MILKLKRFDKTLPLPERKTAGAVGFDLTVRETVTIQPGQIGYAPMNVAIQLPTGTWALIAARSSIQKRGVLLANGIGVGDADFCGDNDEYVAALLNFTSAAVTIEKGERIAQLIIMNKTEVELQEVEHLGNPDRGGFGTTGK